MILLGVETSCDETAAAVVKNGRQILSSEIGTQFDLHRPYSGVVPELASRAHVQLINPVISRALKKARIKPEQLDGIAVTVGPGLVGCLLVGKMTAESLGWVYDVPVYGANHIEGHLLSPILSDPSVQPPFLGLVVSGGHSELIYVRRWGQYELLGRTRDDAAGEAFDKVAKMMNLGYPGGPIVDRLASGRDSSKVVFPRAWLHGTWDFSFSGLKTAVLYKLRTKRSWSKSEIADICAGFQLAVVDVLVTKTMAAAKALKVKTIVIGGGVAANSLLRKQFVGRCADENRTLLMAPRELCTDNAAMVAAAVYFKKQYQKKSSNFSLLIQPQLHIPFSKKSIPVFL